MTTTPAAAPDRTRVLVVDDHPFFREGIVAWLGRQAGLAYCGFADTARGAIAAIEQGKPDLVLLDLQLREGDGFDVLRACRALERSPVLLVLSQKDEGLFAARALRGGARGYMAKGEASETLETAITTVMRGGVYVSGAVSGQGLGSAGGKPEAHPNPLRGLFDRELEVFQLLGRGRSTKEIACEMGISPKTVESYRENLKKKLGVDNSLALVRLAILWQQEGEWPHERFQ